MKVCSYKDLDIVVLLRDEHCPPHVHVRTDKWEARFAFSFWHNSVRLMEVTPKKNSPGVTFIQDLVEVIKEPKNLQKTRNIWWEKLNTLCLQNMMWDEDAEEVVSPKDRRPGAYQIIGSRFESLQNRTVLTLPHDKKVIEL